VLDLDAFLEDLAGSDYEGAVSLEVDLRPALGHDERLATVMVDMRERTERALESAGRAAR
jgi:sugar phosphate isomerase/epimerase